MRTCLAIGENACICALDHCWHNTMDISEEVHLAASTIMHSVKCKVGSLVVHTMVLDSLIAQASQAICLLQLVLGSQSHLRPDPNDDPAVAKSHTRKMCEREFAVIKRLQATLTLLTSRNAAAQQQPRACEEAEFDSYHKLLAALRCGAIDSGCQRWDLRVGLGHSGRHSRQL